jgi:hypothetical protein
LVACVIHILNITGELIVRKRERDRKGGEDIMKGRGKKELTVGKRGKDIMKAREKGGGKAEFGDVAKVSSIYLCIT